MPISTEATLGSVLAKLSGDPATQTTLAAILTALQGTVKTVPQSAVALPAGTALIGGVYASTGSAPVALNFTTTAGTNAQSIKTSAGFLYELSLANPTAATIYVKVYNKATAPTPGTDTPWVVLSVPAGGSTVASFGPNGKRFPAGIGIAVTGAMATTDTTAVAANAIVTGTYS